MQSAKIGLSPTYGSGNSGTRPTWIGLFGYLAYPDQVEEKEENVIWSVVYVIKKSWSVFLTPTKVMNHFKKYKKKYISDWLMYSMPFEPYFDNLIYILTVCVGFFSFELFFKEFPSILLLLFHFWRFKNTIALLILQWKKTKFTYNWLCSSEVWGVGTLLYIFGRKCENYFFIC